MKPFIHENFLLGNNTAEKLYHMYAVNQPIIDFHCHLSPAFIAEDHQFTNLTQAWLEGDHYKWRAMRTNGISEKYCTGNGSDEEKFKKWAETVPATAGVGAHDAAGSCAPRRRRPRPPSRDPRGLPHPILRHRD